MLQKLQGYVTSTKMAKRATSVVARNAPKRRRLTRKPKIELSQLPASVKPEVKFEDIDSGVLISPSFINQLKPTAQGDDGDDFIGSECYLRSVDVTACLNASGWANARLSIVVARDPTVAPTYRIPQQKYGHREFIVLYDEYFSENDKNGIRVKRTLNMKQKYNLSGTLLTEGNVYVILTTDGSVSGRLLSRLYYTDP